MSLPPMIGSNFQVSFLDATGMKLSYSDSLRVQVQAVSMIIQKPDGFEPGMLFLALEEDDGLLVTKGLQALFDEDDFTILVQMLDKFGNPSKNIQVDEAWADHIIHGELDALVLDATVTTVVGIGYSPDLVKIS